MTNEQVAEKMTHLLSQKDSLYDSCEDLTKDIEKLQPVVICLLVTYINTFNELMYFLKYPKEYDNDPPTNEAA